MATALSLFPSRIRFVNADGTLTPEAYRALSNLLYRVGGPVAPSINDLDVQQYADAGIEETRALLLAGLDALAVVPPVATASADDAAFAPPTAMVSADSLDFPPLDIAPLLAGLDGLNSAPVPATPVPEEEFRPPAIEPVQIDALASEVASLRETVAALQTEIDNLKQGTTP